MNLQPLFEMQKQLDQHIVEKRELKNIDLPNKKFVALHTELGELMNEWRGFKYWSTDQEPRTKIYTWINGLGQVMESNTDPRMLVEDRRFNAFGIRNLLLEEYVDCFHFILSIGNSIEAKDLNYSIPYVCEKTIELQHLSLVREITTLHHLLRLGMERPIDTYRAIFMQFVNLGGMLGFTWDQIEQAYYDKNKINHTRQETGY